MEEPTSLFVAEGVCVRAAPTIKVDVFLTDLIVVITDLIVFAWPRLCFSDPMKQLPSGSHSQRTIKLLSNTENPNALFTL